MKVRELIECLQQVDQERVVYVAFDSGIRMRVEVVAAFDPKRETIKDRLLVITDVDTFEYIKMEGDKAMYAEYRFTGNGHVVL